jgi:hypothetical protein
VLIRVLRLYHQGSARTGQKLGVTELVTRLRETYCGHCGGKAGPGRPGTAVVHDQRAPGDLGRKVHPVGGTPVRWPRATVEPVAVANGNDHLGAERGGGLRGRA